MPDPVVVLIEDEAQIRRFLRATLTGQGYRLFEATTGADGLVEVASRQPDVVIVDLGLPDLDGLDVIRRLREWSAVPVIVLSARGQERDKVTALDAGADDYVSKPFGAEELLARIRVALRHAAGASHEGGDAAFTVGDLQVDQLRRQVTVRGAEVKLTPIEYKLLTTLVRHAGKVVTHQQLLREVWGPSHDDQSHYVRVYMAHLRHKLETEPARPRYLLTEPGVGYRLAFELWGAPTWPPTPPTRSARPGAAVTRLYHAMRSSVRVAEFGGPRCRGAVS
jgi:two-component system KDP operon response regulator KdpE